MGRIIKESPRSRKATRQPRSIVYIVCEGSKSEPHYFKGFRSRYSLIEIKTVANFKNNIIIDVSGYSFSLPSNCSAYNNIFVWGDALGVTNQSNNMTADVKTLFGFDTIGFDESNTYKLTEEAKITFLGTDGTQVGIYGGKTPFSDVPSNPQVTQKNIATKCTFDDKLNVNIKAEAQNQGKIIAYEYWSNDSINSRTRINITPVTSLELKNQLLEINNLVQATTPTPDNFEFVPEVYGNAKIYYLSDNQLIIRFLDDNGKWSVPSVSHFTNGKGVDVVADTLYSGIPITKTKVTTNYHTVTEVETDEFGSVISITTKMKPDIEDMHFFKFKALKGYFTSVCFPMIKQENVDGTPFNDGTEIIKKIVEKRADLNLFEKDTLELMIKKTGGSLRDLFEVILNSAQTARRGNLNKISMVNAKLALTMLKSSLSRCIERKHYAFLADIYRGNRQKIEDKEMLLEMLMAGVVLEYNGEHWFKLHPLVAEFLEEQDLTNEKFN